MSKYARELDLRDLNAHTYGLLLTPPGSDVLDVGTADGHPVVEGLRARGCRVWGVEIDPDAAALAAPMCEQMVVGNVESLDLAATFGDRQFDVVLCLDVLEHLLEPLATLRRLADRLTPAGIVVASIPNVTHAAVRLAMMAGHFTYTDTGLLDRTHLRFFDRAEVSALFAEAGLTVVERLEVRREPHETEIDVDVSAVPAETLASVTADPDARVFQWIIVARAGVPETAAELAGLTGLATALLEQVSRLEESGRRATGHVAWLEAELARKSENEQALTVLATGQNERIAELDQALRTRVTELVEAHEQVKALRADLAVKDDYVIELQHAAHVVGAPPPTGWVRQAEQLGAPAHDLVDRLAGRLARMPRTYGAVKRGSRVARRLLRHG